MKSVEILGDYYHNKGIIEDYYDGIPILTICMDDLDILANAEDEDRALQEGVDRVIKKVREIKE